MIQVIECKPQPIADQRTAPLASPSEANGSVLTPKRGVTVLGEAEREEIRAQLLAWVKDLCAGVSTRHIAHATGFNRETVRRYRRGHIMAPAEFVLALCRCRGMTFKLVPRSLTVSTEGNP